MTELLHPQYRVSTAFASSQVPILRGDEADAVVFWSSMPARVTVHEFDFNDPENPLIGVLEIGATELIWLQPDELTFRGRAGL